MPRSVRRGRSLGSPNAQTARRFGGEILARVAEVPPAAARLAPGVLTESAGGTTFEAPRRAVLAARGVEAPEGIPRAGAGHAVPEEREALAAQMDHAPTGRCLRVNRGLGGGWRRRRRREGRQRKRRAEYEEDEERAGHVRWHRGQVKQFEHRNHAIGPVIA